MKQNSPKLDKLPQTFAVGDLSARRATSLDVPRLVEIINVGFSYQNDVRGRSRLTDSEQRLLLKTDVVYCLENKVREIIGTISANLSSDRENTLHLTRLAVDELYREKGIGRKLMAEMERIAKLSGYKAVDIGYMHVAPKWLFEFYKHIGYKPIKDSTYDWQGVKISEMIKNV